MYGRVVRYRKEPLLPLLFHSIYSLDAMSNNDRRNLFDIFRFLLTATVPRSECIEAVASAITCLTYIKVIRANNFIS